jgi:hypothetical protein
MIPRQLVASEKLRLGVDVASSVSGQSTGHCEISRVGVVWSGPRNIMGNHNKSLQLSPKRPPGTVNAVCQLHEALG